MSSTHSEDIEVDFGWSHSFLGVVLPGLVISVVGIMFLEMLYPEEYKLLNAYTYRILPAVVALGGAALGYIFALLTGRLAATGGEARTTFWVVMITLFIAQFLSLSSKEMRKVKEEHPYYVEASRIRSERNGIQEAYNKVGTSKSRYAKAREQDEERRRTNYEKDLARVERDRKALEAKYPDGPPKIQLDSNFYWDVIGLVALKMVFTFLGDAAGHWQGTGDRRRVLRNRRIAALKEENEKLLAVIEGLQNQAQDLQTSDQDNTPSVDTETPPGNQSPSTITSGLGHLVAHLVPRT